MSATAATASGQHDRGGHSRCRAARGSRPAASSHSLTKAVPGGSADAASAPSPNAAVVTGITARSPPSASRSRVPVACSTDPAARNSSVLNAAWPSTCSSAAVNASAASTRSPGGGEQPARPDPDQHQAHVLGGRVRQQPLQVGADDGLQDPVDRRERAHCQHEQPPPAACRRPAGRTRPGRSRTPPCSPSPPTSAPTRGSAPPGARGAATRAAARSRPSTRTRPGTARTPVRPRPVTGARAARTAAKESPRAGAASTSSPIRIATNPRWVITAYQRPADATAARRRCSATTSSSEVSAISSQHTSNVATLPATGTSSSDTTNSGSTACTPRPSRCPSRRAVPDPVDRRDRGDRAAHGEEHPAQRVHRKHHARQRQQPGQLRPTTLPTHRGDPGRRRRAPQPRRSAHRPRPDGRPRGKQQCGQHGAQQPRTSAELNADRDQVHRPVSVRSAATIASGRGGQPGTSRSTGTTSPTAPTTP